MSAGREFLPLPAAAAIAYARLAGVRLDESATNLSMRSGDRACRHNGHLRGRAAAAPE